jgi:serine/threonine protein kinase
MKESPQRAKDIFVGALRLAPALRQAYLHEACGDDDDLRRRVQNLLAADLEAGSFLKPVAHVGLAERDDPCVEKPGAMIGPYKLLQQIGEGGMGSVFMAEQAHPVQRKVALKIVKPGMDSKQVIARFEVERQALAMMDHQNIARVLDAGTTGEGARDERRGASETASALAPRPSPLVPSAGRPYFVMELVHGVPITQFCDERKLTLRERLALFVPVCKAIHHAHQKGIIHRDVKPSNVLVTMYDDKPVPKVIDFGVAKALEQRLTERTLFTQFGALVGTFEYMSPEQAEMNAFGVDTRSDIYSLGVLLYELLTGTTPLENTRLREAALDETVRMIREEEAPRPSLRLSSSDNLAKIAAARNTDPARLSRLVRGEIDWIAMKCLEKDRSRRYDTASALAMDVERYLNNEAVEACPPSPAYRLRKFVRRHQRAVLAAATVVFLLIAGIVGTTWGLVNAVEARHDEAEQRRIAEAKEAEALADKAAALAAADRERQATQREFEQRRVAESLQRVAQANERKALAESQVAEAVRNFLQSDLLRQASARKQADTLRLRGGGFKFVENPTIKELLDRAAVELTPAKIDTKFPDQPEVQASILRTVGGTYLAVGEYKKAIDFLTRACVLYRDTCGADHPDTRVTLNELAVTYLEAGNPAKAIAMLEEVRQLYAQAGDRDGALDALSNLGAALRAAGDATRAITLLEEVRDARLAQLGPDHLTVLPVLNNLALSYFEAGRLPQAIALFEKVRDGRAKELGDKHPATLTAMNNLAQTYDASGRVAEAIALYEQVRDAQMTLRGADHPETIATLNNLGSAYSTAGEMPRAIALLEQARDAITKKLGADHPLTLTTMNNLALAYHRSGKLAQAIVLYEQVRDGLVARRGAEHPATLTTISNLAGAYRDAGKQDEALPLIRLAAEGVHKHKFLHPDAQRITENLVICLEERKQYADAELWRRRWLAHLRQRGDVDTPEYAGELAVLGVNLLAQHKWVDAESTLREALSLREKLAAGPNPRVTRWLVANTQSMLGEALAGQAKYTAAEPLLLAGYEGLKAQAATIPPPWKIRLVEALDRLVHFYQATKRNDEAATWQQALEQASAELHAPPKK